VSEPLGERTEPTQRDAVPRREYVLGALTEDDLGPEPLPEVERWVGEAAAAGLPDEMPMTLATVDPDGTPSARIVLLRGIDERGLRFFTNYDSAKGRALAADPTCALVLHWPVLERQIRITGVAERLPDDESATYFAGRPRGSQLAAWASEQSEVLPDRTVLEARLAEAEARFEGVDVPMPPDWGGYVVRPSVVELWQGRSSRLHDRLRYRATASGWVLERLAP
jgi:pyridoxamine 5'-phosphate oxidase